MQVIFYTSLYTLRYQRIFIRVRSAHDCYKKITTLFFYSLYHTHFLPAVRNISIRSQKFFYLQGEKFLKP